MEGGGGGERCLSSREREAPWAVPESIQPSCESGVSSLKGKILGLKKELPALKSHDFMMAPTLYGYRGRSRTAVLDWHHHGRR